MSFPNLKTIELMPSSRTIPLARSTMGIPILAMFAFFLFLTGCGKPDSTDKPPRVVVITNVVTTVRYADVQQIMAEALESMNLDEKQNFMPPMPSEADASTNKAAKIRLMLHDNAIERNMLVTRKQEYEEQIREQDPEVRDIYNTFQDARKKYDELMADRLYPTMVLGKIALLTQRQRDLSRMLRNYEEKK